MPRRPRLTLRAATCDLASSRRQCALLSHRRSARGGNPVSSEHTFCWAGLFTDSSYVPQTRPHGGQPVSEGKKVRPRGDQPDSDSTPPAGSSDQGHPGARSLGPRHPQTRLGPREQPGPLSPATACPPDFPGGAEKAWAEKCTGSGGEGSSAISCQVNSLLVLPFFVNKLLILE